MRDRDDAHDSWRGEPSLVLDENPTSMQHSIIIRIATVSRSVLQSVYSGPVSSAYQSSFTTASAGPTFIKKGLTWLAAKR